MSAFKSISIANLRRIKDLRIDGLNQFNIIVGDNNIGKTTLLEALFLSINPNNPTLAFKSNIFRNIDIIDSEFWLSLFRDFNLDRTITIEAAFSDRHKRQIKITPLFSESSLQIEQVDNKIKTNGVSPSSSIPEIAIYGLQSSFQITGEGKQAGKYKSIASFGPAGPKNISDPKYGEEKLIGHFLNSASYGNNDDLAVKFWEISKEKKEGEIIKVIQEIEPTIKGIYLNEKRRIVVDDERFKQKVSLNTYGNGLYRITNVIISLYRALNGVILIDEIENGLDRKSQKILWQAIFAAAKESNTQVFVATHSTEMIKNFYGVALKNKLLDKINVIRLEFARGEIATVRLNAEKLLYSLEQQWEIR